MTTANPAGNQVVRIVWSGKQAPTVVLLRDAKDVVDSSQFWPESFECEAIDVLDALDVLSSLAHPDMETVRINGVEARVATSTSGESRFIPTDETDGVEVLEYGSSSWLPGGPCVMEQIEMICRYGDLYWVEAIGDSTSHCIVVGRFDEISVGLSTAIKLSTFFSFDDEGQVECKLDEFPHEK